MRFYGLFVFLALIGFSACKKENSKSGIPQIAFLSVAPDKVKAGSSKDSIMISFKFQDGDADLGNDPMGTVRDIFLKHSKNDTLDFEYYLPYIPEELKDPVKGFEGTATVVLKAAFLLLDSQHPQGDTFHYEIYIKDRAGNESNHIMTPDIYLTP